MKRVRWLSGLLSAGVLSFTLATVGAQVAQAQRPIFLLDLTCVNRGNGQYEKSSEDISVGRELYTSVLRVYLMRLLPVDSQEALHLCGWNMG